MAQANFIDLDIRVRKVDASRYAVEAQQPGQPIAGPEPLNWSSLSSEDFQNLLERIRNEPYTVNQSIFSEVGAALFDALFGGQVLRLFTGIYDREIEPNENAYLRLRLDIDEHAPEVAVLPWEFLYWKNVYLATQTKTLVTRQLPNLEYGSIKTLTISGKPRVLIAVPGGSELANAEREKEIIIQVLTDAGIEYKALDGRVSVNLLNDELATEHYHILHFIGHGEFKEGDDGVLLGMLRFNPPEEVGKAEDEEWVGHEQLQAMLGNYASLKLVALNACEGAEIADAATTPATRSGRGFIGMAPAILKAGVPAVAAMQYRIRDDVALQFADTFYKRLTSGHWIGQVDTAITLARNACFVNFPDDRGFATPILYLRSGDGVIFRVEERPDSDDEACSEPPKPADSLLHKYRHDTVETLTRAVKSTREQMALVQRTIQYNQRLEIEKPLLAAGGRTQLETERLQGQEQELQSKLDELLQVLRWKAYELCGQRQKLRQDLAGMEGEKTRLESAGQYVPIKLGNDIVDLTVRLRQLDDLATAAERELS